MSKDGKWLWQVIGTLSWLFLILLSLCKLLGIIRIDYGPMNPPKCEVCSHVVDTVHEEAYVVSNGTHYYHVDCYRNSMKEDKK